MEMQGPQDLSTPVCQQCGLSHPMLQPGEKCPMAKENSPTGEEINYNQFMINIKNIVSSQIQFNEIKDPNKMFAYLTVEFLKIAENYKENEEKNKESE